MRTILYLLGLLSVGAGIVLSMTVIGLAPGIGLVISGFFFLVFARLLENQEKMQLQINKLARRLKIGEGKGSSGGDFDIEEETKKFLREGRM